MKVKKSLKLFSIFIVFNTDFTVEMAPKTKTASSSSSAIALKIQMGGSSMQEASISGNKMASKLVSDIKEA